MADAAVFSHRHSEGETRRFATGAIVMPGPDRLYVIEDQAIGRYLGQAGIFHISPSEKTAEINLLIAETANHRKGTGTAAVSLLTHKAFTGLGLRRLTASVPEHNPCAAAFSALAHHSEQYDYTDTG